MLTKNVEVDIDVDLDDFEDDEIRAEYKKRKLDGADWHEADVRRLAEHIVAGERDDALDLLGSMTDGAFNPKVVKMLARAA